ncbi:hypothetical protein KJ633_05155 [bacterium]|nr:hypothetical protein [bacterium]MBU3955829.1 hypothetical protein [bacterium]
MPQVIENLIKLQAKDSELDSLAVRHAAIPVEIDNIQNEAAVLNVELKEKENVYKNKAVAQQNLENDIRKLEEEIKKSQSELYAVKTNELYATVLEGIKDKKNKVSDTETALLKLMDEVMAEKKSLAELKESAAKKTSGGDSRCRELNSEKDALAAAITQKKVLRDEDAENMRSDSALAKALEKYERIRKSKGGVAIVKVSDGNVCVGCNIALTKQQIIDISSSDIVLCENCGRILFADEKQRNS